MTVSKKLLLTIKDLKQSLLRWQVWTTLAWIDVRQKYRRAVIGPFWITISMAIFLGTMAIVYGALLRVDLRNYLPYLAGGMVAWFMVSTVLTEGAFAYIAADALIKQGGMPLMLHVFRVIWRNIIVLAHNAVVMFAIYIWLWFIPLSHLPMLFFGIVLVVLNLTWMVLVLAPLCTRYRDLPPIVNSIVQVSFFVTPVIFTREQLPAHARWIVDFNPFAYLVNVIRAPLIGQPVEGYHLVVLAGMLVIGWGAALLLMTRVRSRVAFWL